MNKLIVPAVVAAVVSCPIASAQVIEVDSEFGVGTATRDVAQNLDFPDLTQSTGRSFDDVSSQFGVGGDFEGWRYATMQEVVDLILNWGFSPSITTPASDLAALFLVGDAGGDQLSGLVQLVGLTNSSTSANVSLGYTSDVLTGSQAGQARTVSLLDDVSAPTSEDAVHFSWLRPDLSIPRAGSWLVRAVPTPSAAALLGAGLLAGARRRR